MSDVDDDQPLTLADACAVLFNNAIGPDTLRAEAARGRLIMEKIGRRYFVTRAGIREMRRKCLVAPPPKDPDSGSSQNARTQTAASKPQSGSSATDPVSVARAAALMTLEELSKPSKNISRKSTSRKSGTVIRLKS